MKPGQPQEFYVFLFRITAPKKLLENEGIHAAAMKSHSITLKDGKFHADFETKPEAKALRDVLIAHGIESHVEFGPDHWRQA